MNRRIRELAEQAGIDFFNSIDPEFHGKEYCEAWTEQQQKFAQFIIQECITQIETYRIPVGNSAAGEMACELTYAALKEIRDDIKETFGFEK